MEGAKSDKWENGTYCSGFCNNNHLLNKLLLSYFRYCNCEICNRKGHLKKVCYFNKNKIVKN